MEEDDKKLGTGQAGLGDVQPLPKIAVAPGDPAPKAESDSSGSGMKSLMRMARILFLCLRVLIIVILAYLLMSGVFRVDEQNEAMLFRFGALQSRQIENQETSVLTSGRWYWAWPYPIDWVKVLSAQRTVTVSTETFFEPWVKPEPGQAPNRFLRPGADGYLLTGDTNIIHAVAEVNYRIGDPQKYYLEFFDDSEAEGLSGWDSGETTGHHGHGKTEKNERKRGTVAIMQNLLANALLSVSASWSVEDLRTKIKKVGETSVNIEVSVQEKLEMYLKEIDLGVEVQSVKVTFQLPYATLKAFDSVFAASEMGNAEKQKAHLDASTLLSNADGMAAKIRNEALAYKRNIVESVRADSTYFKTVLAEYKDHPETMLMVLYTDALQEALSKVENKYVLHEKQDSLQEIRLQIGQVPEKSKAPNQEQEAGGAAQ